MFVEDDKSPRPKSILKRKVRDVERPQQTHKSKWDQFCDFSSLVGFRLLHSKHSPKLRFVSAIVMFVSAGLIFYQTQSAIKRLVQSDNRKIGYVTQDDTGKIDQPEFLVCVTNQAFTIERAYGNVDFRLLVANYLSGSFTPEMVSEIKEDIEKLKNFFSAGYLNNDSDVAMKTAESLGTSLKYFRQIESILSFNFSSLVDVSANRSVIPSSTSFDWYQTFRSEVDDCLLQYSNDQSQFTNCRYSKAEAHFNEFLKQEEDYFRYVSDVSMSAEKLIVKSGFYGDKGIWRQEWEVANELCVRGGPLNRKRFGIADVKSSKNFDYILVRVNAFEMVKSAKAVVHFLHNGIRANVVELVPGKSLEVTIRGASEIMTEGCENAYPEGCVPPGTNYTQYKCRWCIPKTREACNCNNPESYLENYIDKYNKNCSFLEVAKCSPDQKLSYSQGRSNSDECRNPCETFGYSLGYALQELTVEMLEMSTSDEDRVAEEYQVTMDRMMDFQFYQSLNDRKFENAIWKTRADLDRNFLSKYYTMVIHFYKVVYGSDFKFPAIFLEDLADPLRYQLNASIKSVMDLANLSLGAVDTCGNPDLQAALVQFSAGFFEYFRNTSFHKWYPCPISLSAESCANFLSFTWNATVLEKLKKNIMSVSGSRQSTLELAITLNASAVNPFAIVQFYSKVENLKHFNQMKKSLKAEAQTLLRLMNGLSRPINECMRKKLRNLETVSQSEIVNDTNDWALKFQQFLKRNKGLYLMDDYLKANFALLTIYYQGLSHQQVIYRDDYSFWDFMTELGGNLGLYFGLTIITVYEMLVFLMIDKEPPEARVPIEHKFTKRILYRHDPAILQTDQPIPTIF
ncbi:amiloride-sensitive sodium channel domain-containing protein [Ditylenchus destructor]|nr:amiloride-sensitive sodium channel domain-containing protein [Ditylenchus destructor]